MREELYDKLQRYYYDTKSDLFKSMKSVDDWINDLSNVELIKLIDEVGGC